MTGFIGFSEIVGPTPPGPPNKHVREESGRNREETMSDQKDRFGDKLREREQAEEDRYFARQDREKLERLREQQEPAATLGLCPKCGVTLVAKDQLGVTIDQCENCGGLWLDKGELEAIEARKDEGWPTTWFRSILGNRS